MAIFQGLFFLVLGAGLVAVSWSSLRTGWLPCGPKGLKGRLEFTRASEPCRFWIMFIFYASFGIYLFIFSLRLFVGIAEPLPLM